MFASRSMVSISNRGKNIFSSSVELLSIEIRQKFVAADDVVVVVVVVVVVAGVVVTVDMDDRHFSNSC